MDKSSGSPILEAARTGCFGSICLEQTHKDFLRANSWCCQLQGCLQVFECDGQLVGSVYDFRPYFEIFLNRLGVIEGIDFFIADRSVYSNAQVNSRSKGLTGGDSIVPIPDLCGMFEDMQLEGLERVLLGTKISVLAADAIRETAEEFRIRVESYLELVLGRIEPEDSISLFKVRLTQFRNRKADNSLLEIEMAMPGWVNRVKEAIDSP